MKNIIHIFLGVGMILLFSCNKVEEEKAIVVLCEDDHAEYTFDSSLFTTTYSTEGSEFMTVDGDNCGIAAALDETNNILFLAIAGQDQEVRITAADFNLNEKEDYRNLTYTNSNVIFNNLSSNYDNHIIIEELDLVGDKVKGTFSFQIENETGEITTISNGKFNCGIQKF